MPDYKKLQNGSDIRGVAIAVEGGITPRQVDPETLRNELRKIGGYFH